MKMVLQTWRASCHDKDHTWKVLTASAHTLLDTSSTQLQNRYMNEHCNMYKFQKVKSH